MKWHKASILSGINPAGLEELSRIATVKAYEQDSVVISEGDAGVSFFIVDRGILRVEKGGHKLAEKKEGDHFGLMAVFENTSRSADIIASTVCALVEINWEQLRHNISDVVYQQIITNHFNDLQNNLRQMNTVLVSALVKNEALIDQVYGIREKLSSDLHDDVGTLLAGLSMQSELLILQGVEQMNGLLEEVGNMSKEAMERLRDIVWAVDSRKDKYQNLIFKMRDFAAVILSRDQFTTHFDSEGIDEQSIIEPSHREQLYFIFKEALLNIAKHSNGDEVWISLRREADLTLSIKDNGTKRDQQKTDGLGLSNIRMRADKIGAELVIDAGEMFEVRVGIGV